LLKKSGFELTKWSFNHAFLQDVKGSHKKKFNLSVDHNNSQIRALGVSWNCDLDVIKFIGVRQHPPLQKPTNCAILSRIVLIFNFLGLLGPSVIIAKLLIQEL